LPHWMRASGPPSSSASTVTSKESGIGGGDAIDVELTLDTAPRTVEVPDDLQSVLRAAP
jgi:hypothetical protein